MNMLGSMVGVMNHHRVRTNLRRSRSQSRRNLLDEACAVVLAAQW